MPTTGRRIRWRGLAALAAIAAVTWAAVARPTYGLPNVAVLGAPGDPSWNDDVQAKLLATGQFGLVDVYNIAVVTPSLSQMQDYCGLLVYTDSPSLASPVLFGNTLADYVDAGGGVVTAVFATASLPIQGRFNTGDYWAIQPTSQISGDAQTLGVIYDPGHPILAGVSGFSGGPSSYRPSLRRIHPSATVVADWTGFGDIPLIATRLIGLTRRVDLGFFPPSDDARIDFWDSTTDGALIMANALTWACATSNCGNGLLDSGEQCDDGNTGNGDGCSAICRVEPCHSCSGAPSTCSALPDGSACDDRLFCNGTDSCTGALCSTHSGDPCVGGGDCTDDCNEANNTCIVAGSACADDSNECTEDECDAAGVCEHSNEFFTSCDDGVFCNGADSCFDGTCQLHDGDPCQFDPCQSGCSEMTGMCNPSMAGTPCASDFDVCTSDQCDGAGSCAHPPGPDGVACVEDGNDCTGDECAAGVCAHPALPSGRPCAADSSSCTDDQCDGARACVHLPRGDGASCDDGNACTQTDECEAGVCVGSDPVVCSGELCKVQPTCDTQTGACTSCPPGYTAANGGCQKRYAIHTNTLDGLSFSCDLFGVNRYNGCSSGAFGFHWTDTATSAVGSVLRVDVALNDGLDCGDAHTVRLNSAPIGVYASTTGTSCQCDAPLVARAFSSMPPASYVKGGANAVTITTNDCAGLNVDTNGNFASVAVTYADLGAPLAIRDGCRQAAKSRFQYRDNDNDARDKMRWNWGKGEATTQPELSDPTTSADYELCVFMESTDAPALLLGADVPADSTRWRAAGSTGFRYDDNAAAVDGMQRMLLRGGADGKSKLVVKGAGAALGDPALPLPLTLNGIRVQLTNESNGKCWESEFPLNTITADERRIRAKTQ